MEIDLSTKQTYAEVDAFIEMLNEEEKNKIPKKLRNIFKDNKDVSYNKNILELVENNKLKNETLAIIAFLNLKYWCKDENEKKYLMKIYDENERKYQEKITEKYNPNNIFKNNVVSQENSAQSTELTKVEENFFQKIIRKIKMFFNK